MIALASGPSWFAATKYAVSCSGIRGASMIGEADEERRFDHRDAGARGDARRCPVHRRLVERSRRVLDAGEHSEAPLLRDPELVASAEHCRASERGGDSGPVAGEVV